MTPEREEKEARQRAYAWAARNVAEWLRLYANAELSTMSTGMKPSAISEAVALICRNLADSAEKDADALSLKLIEAEQHVIAAARTENPTKIMEALGRLDITRHRIDERRRAEAMRRLADPR